MHAAAFATPAAVRQPTPLLAPVAARFSLETLDWALCTASELRDSWTQGVDESARIDGLIRDLGDDVRVLEGGLRDDDAVRDRATAALRRLSALYRRDKAVGLVAVPRNFDDSALHAPDAIERLSRD